MKNCAIGTMVQININSMVLFYSNTTAVEPVLADVALDHEAAHVVRLAAHAVHGRRGGVVVVVIVVAAVVVGAGGAAGGGGGRSRRRRSGHL